MAERISQSICRDCGTADGMDWTAHWARHDNISAETRCHPCYLEYLRDKNRRKNAAGGHLVRTARPRAAKAPQPLGLDCQQCGTPLMTYPSGKGGPRKYCSVVCANKARYPNPQPRSVRRRLYSHARRTKERRFDLTPAIEREMRRKARTCPLCDCRLLNTSLKPRSKELDHIIPVNVGGTTTIGNVRIICRLCNQKRPKDGSDVVGQVTLWATEVDVLAEAAILRLHEMRAKAASRPPKPGKGRRTPVRYFDCYFCGLPSCNNASVKLDRCRRPECERQHRRLLNVRQWRDKPGDVRQASRDRAERAHQLRQAGEEWADIAATLGYGGPHVASAAVTRWKQGVDYRSAA
jgi:hypothetical protein